MGVILTNPFDALLDEKRERVISAAMTVFAAHGYRKASVADIAKAAGISKAMVFTYFGSKSRLYVYLAQLTVRLAMGKFKEAESNLLGERDFFERILLSVRLKVSIMTLNRAMLDFSASMFFERDSEVRPEIEPLLTETYRMRSAFLEADIDISKFRNPGDMAKLSMMTEWLSNGCADYWNIHPGQSLEEYLSVFDNCLLALKKHYYKEEYL
jgi:AcrR family transcriptional regulator